MDIRLAKDRQTGHSRGFAFITWSSVADCKQVLEYLQKATPKFNVDGTVVLLDYANGLPNKQNQVDLKGIIQKMANFRGTKHTDFWKTHPGPLPNSLLVIEPYQIWTCFPEINPSHYREN